MLILSLFSEVWALRKERETIEKELEHLQRRNESLKAEFEQEKQVYPVFPLQLLYHPPLVSHSQEKFAAKVSDVYCKHTPHEEFKFIVTV